MDINFLVTTSPSGARDSTFRKVVRSNATKWQHHLARSPHLSPRDREMEIPPCYKSPLPATAPTTQPVNHLYERACPIHIANAKHLHSEASPVSSDLETASLGTSETNDRGHTNELQQYLANSTQVNSLETRCEVRSPPQLSASTLGPVVETSGQQHEFSAPTRILSDDFSDLILPPTTPIPSSEHEQQTSGEDRQSWMSIDQPCWQCFELSPDPGFSCNAVFTSLEDLQRHHTGRHCYFRCRICHKFDRIQNRGEHLERHKHGLPSLDECLVCGDRFDPTKGHDCYDDTFVATDMPDTSTALGLNIGF